ncbi:hypothetical protein CYMTET_6999 [Cymbomonas tetramitiformis]|uniref:Uncharacterized protein n=1 Tax=Cymbomonas tetramitiformis TaxID=36881 RepID=A0AAE0GWG6_9CHLO|nr:hypothetical protein CYMTET_6999 [Cymbomonas tetramitiformis]
MTREVYGDDGDYEGFVPNPKFEEFKDSVSQQHTDLENRMQAYFEQKFAALKFEEFKDSVSQQHTDFEQKFAALKFEEFKDSVSQQHTDLENRVQADFEQKFATFKADIFAERDEAWRLQMIDIEKVEEVCKDQAKKIEMLQQENLKLKGEVEALKSTQKSQFSVLWACLKPTP